MLTAAILTREALPPPHDPQGAWLLRIAIDDGHEVIAEWQSMSDAAPRADQLDDALDGSGWVLGGPLLETSPGTWSLDLSPDPDR